MIYDPTNMPPDVNQTFATSNNLTVQELLKATQELASRRMEALRLYEPSEFQDNFHRCPAKERVIQGANQVGKAAHGDELVLTPTGWARIGDLKVGDAVVGGDGFPCRVIGVYPQGKRELYRVTFDDDSSVLVCAEHLWKCIGIEGRAFDGHVYQTSEVIEKMSQGIVIGVLNPPKEQLLQLPHINPEDLRYEAKARWFKSIEPAGEHECFCIRVHNDDHTFIITKDFIVTHNSLAAFVEDARAVTGQDPYNKYPKKDGVLVCLGLDERHIGTNITRYLLKQGAFRIIRDQESNEWRAWKPWIPEDAARKHETLPAPPLIPKRFIKDIAWVKRNSGVFSKIELTTGWVIYAHSSKGEPAAGYQADLYHIDEDVQRPDWYDEAVARLTIREGKFIWSALPLARNRALLNVIARAKEQEALEEPTSVVFKASVFDNPYMPEESRKANIERWKSQGEDIFLRRAMGELTTDSFLMYPMFSKIVHDAFGEQFQLDDEDPRKILAGNDGVPPPDWCLYATVDPGFNLFATVFWCVPPPAQFKRKLMIAYDELYLPQTTAPEWAKRMREKTFNRVFQAFIMDMHGGRIRHLATGELPARVYQEALANEGVYSMKTGSGFMAGCDQIGLREEETRNAMLTNPDGLPQFLINWRRCVNTTRELERFRKQTVNTPDGPVTIDKGDRRANTHGVECIEYGIAHGLEYVMPRGRPKGLTWAEQIMAEKKRRAARRRAKNSLMSQSYISLGPPQ